MEADFDTGAFFGFPGAVGTPAPSAVRCAVTLEGPEPPERYKELVAAVDEHCPVLDLFTRSVPVERTVTIGVTRTTTLPAILSCSAWRSRIPERPQPVEQGEEPEERDDAEQPDRDVAEPSPADADRAALAGGIADLDTEQPACRTSAPSRCR